MTDKLQNFIVSNDLFTKENRLLLALSGGIDSVTLADALFKAGYRFDVAHCNFGLRGEASDQDELFARKLAKKYKAHIHVEYFETKAYAEKEKVSVQMAARSLRYIWFEELIQCHGYDYLLTAHHQNDVLETVLFNLTKGTGISGLHGILAKKGKTVRPMLFASKEDVYDYVVENQLIWREDESNQENKYSRNLIRNEVVGHLKKINPNLENTILQTVEKVSAVERVFVKQAEKFIKDISHKQDGLLYCSIEKIKDEEEALIKLYYYLESHGFSYAQCKDIIDKLDAQAGTRFESPTHFLIKDREYLILKVKSIKAFSSIEIQSPQDLFKTDAFEISFEKKPYQKGDKIPTKKNEAFLDAAALKFPLKIRPWKEGDWFCPLGMNKKKKISDFLIDSKVPLAAKDNVMVMLSGHSIVWVMGHRIDNRYKVGNKSSEAIYIKLRRN